jgi:hypothetical protein
MKKTLLTLAVVAAAVASQAQGFVSFSDSGNSRISTNSAVGGAQTGRIAANAGTTATTYYFALFVSSTAPSATAAISGTSASTYAFQNGSGWTFDNPTTTAGYIGPAYGTNGPTAGQFNSSVQDANNTSQTLLASGAAQYFVVVGWSGNIGSTLAALQAWYNNGSPVGVTGWVGQSAASGQLTPSAGGSAAALTLFGTNPGLIPGFGLGEAVPTPEPATMALAAIGGAK